MGIQLTNSRFISGVLSFTHEALGKQVDDFLSLMGYLHVQLSGTSAETLGKTTVIIDSPSAQRARVCC